MRKWLFLNDTGVIDQKLGREIVRAVNDKIILPDQLTDVRRIHKHMVGIDLHIQIHSFHRFFC